MPRIPLFDQQEHPELDRFLNIVRTGRYFRQINPQLLRTVLKKGYLLELPREQRLIREGDLTPPEMFILISGSLAVMSHDKFILRLELPGDMVGEMSIVSQGPRSADVLTETECELIAFPSEVFAADPTSEQVPVFYLMFAHLMAEKLRVTTAQSLIRKNERVLSPNKIHVAIIDENMLDRMIVRGVLESQWPEAQPIEFENIKEFVDSALKYHFSLIVTDVLFEGLDYYQKEVQAMMFSTMKVYGCPIFVLSQVCNAPDQRIQLIELGADQFLAKPYSIFDLKHELVKLRVWHYKQQELDRIEQVANTDRLTGLANRRRMEEFLEALYTLYPDNRQKFSLIIADVDNFKHYNDKHGHQMGDVVLAGVAAIFSQNVRRGDLAARFGGEEFVMILPNCNKENAIKVGEKLRKAVADEVFPFEELQPLGDVTATFGVATYPDDADNIEELLKRADDCLYRGKEAGRNKVIGADRAYVAPPGAH